MADVRIYDEALDLEAIQAIMAGEGLDSIRGDFNRNGQLDVGDLDELAVGMSTNDLTYDLNGDNRTDIDDRLLWVHDLKGTWMGDADLDGEFNSSDFVRVFAAGLYERDVLATWDQGDWDGDLRFDSSDFVVAFTDGGYEQGPIPPANAVPEPSSILLMTLGSSVSFGESVSDGSAKGLRSSDAPFCRLAPRCRRERRRESTRNSSLRSSFCEICYGSRSAFHEKMP